MAKIFQKLMKDISLQKQESPQIQTTKQDK